ncbi:MAG: tripartite tricarboxylate transporter TctB family protein [Limnohabitans sp.]|nr:tripartite tricarboxylate transporter TctB family protein [Limnohabitans sp.]
MNIKSQKDFVSGLMFLTLGVGFAWGATSYTIGAAARMGPGYFPMLLGGMLAIFGAVIMLYSLVVETPSGEKIGGFAWRPVVYILGSNVAFGILLGGLPKLGLAPMGLIVAIFGLTLISAKAGSEFKLKEVLMLAAGLSVMSYFAFIKLLNLQMLVWPTFITG